MTVALMMRDIELTFLLLLLKRKVLVMLLRLLLIVASISSAICVHGHFDHR